MVRKSRTYGSGMPSDKLSHKKRKDMPSSGRKTTSNKWTPVVVAPILVAIIGTIGIIISTLLGKPPPPPHTPTPEPITSKYSFEEGVQGWIKQEYKDSQACIKVLQSKEKAHDGLFSLAMSMDLNGGDPDNHKRKGEAWIDMQASHPSGVERIPINLTDRTVTVWVYAPQGARGSDDKHPNGFQVFVKSKKGNDWYSEYSRWYTVVEGGWTLISLTLRASGPKKDEIDQGAFRNLDFDPTQVIAIGVKMGAGDSQTATYQGLIYVDEIDW